MCIFTLLKFDLYTRCIVNGSLYHEHTVGDHVTFLTGRIRRVVLDSKQSNDCYPQAGDTRGTCGDWKNQ